VLKIKEKQTSLLSSSGRSGTSIGGGIGERESTGSGAATPHAGEKTLPDTRTRLMQLYVECIAFQITFSFNTPVSVNFASLAKCATNILPFTIFNLRMVQDPKEFQNLNTSLVKGEVLAEDWR
jgi:hypothetical protein